MTIEDTDYFESDYTQILDGFLFGLQFDEIGQQSNLVVCLLPI